MTHFRGDGAWHVHHEVLCEPLTEPIENRIKYIRENKPEAERALRLRLLKPVQGKVPSACGKAGDAYDKAGDAYDKAWDAYGKAGDAYTKAWAAYTKAGDSYGKAGAAYDKAGDSYGKAWAAYTKAWAAALPALEKLHAKECPDCPWDGETIFGGESR